VHWRLLTGGCAFRRINFKNRERWLSNPEEAKLDSMEAEEDVELSDDDWM
jgi:hypothetical protein